MTLFTIGYTCFLVGFVLGTYWKDHIWLGRISQLSYDIRYWEKDGFAEAINDLLQEE